MNLRRLVNDHQIQAGISLAVAMGVWHFKGHEGTRQPVCKVEDVIDILKENEQVLISDPDEFLHFDQSRTVVGTVTLKWVSRVAYISAVVVLAANAIDIQRQIRESDDRVNPRPTSEQSSTPLVSPEESKRLHLDWWGKCRTCKWWNCSSERDNLGEFSCLAGASTLYSQKTTSDGYCPEWDSFDLDIALDIMTEGEVNMTEDEVNSGGVS